MGPMPTDPADHRENDVDTDDALANSRETGGIGGEDDGDAGGTTGTGENEGFVGRVSGQDDGGAEEVSGAEARAAGS